MKIGLDVAQTSAQRAGCAWYADALARALVSIGRPLGHAFVLYHQFGDWINGEPAHGTHLTGKGIEMPMQQMLPVPARALWRAIEAGTETALPGSPVAARSNKCTGIGSEIDHDDTDGEWHGTAQRSLHNGRPVAGTSARSCGSSGHRDANAGSTGREWNLLPERPCRMPNLHSGAPFDDDRDEP